MLEWIASSCALILAVLLLRRLLRGRFYDVRITSAADYDLYGETSR